MFKFIGETSLFSKYDEMAFLIWITLNSCSVQISSSGWTTLSSDSLPIIFVVRSLIFWIWDSRDLSNLLKSLKLPFWSINLVIALISFVIPATQDFLLFLVNEYFHSHGPPPQTFSEASVYIYVKKHVKNSLFLHLTK